MIAITKLWLQFWLIIALYNCSCLHVAKGVSGHSESAENNLGK